MYRQGTYCRAHGALPSVMWLHGWEGGLRRMDTRVCRAESLCCSPETITILLWLLIFCFRLHWVFIADQGLSLAQEVGLLFLAVCGLLTGVASLADTGSSSLAPQLWQMGSVALWPVGSFQTRDQTYVPYTGRWILNHWITRKGLPHCYSVICQYKMKNFKNRCRKIQILDQYISSKSEFSNRSRWHLLKL